jgi:transposase InsO family protein
MKEVVAYVVSSHGYSEHRACQVTSQHRSTQRKPSTRDPRTEVRQRMHEIVATRIRYGYRHVHVMLKREGGRSGGTLFTAYIAKKACLYSAALAWNPTAVDTDLVGLLALFDRSLLVSRVALFGGSHQCRIDDLPRGEIAALP